MIEINISGFSYRKEKVLDKISLTLENGRTYGVAGLNGSGKTTLFRLLAGHLKSEGQKLLYNGKPLLKREVSFLETELYFYPNLTAGEFLSVFPAHSATYNEAALAELFNLPPDEMIQEYSSGMQKKLMLMCLLKQDREIYILDEPFNGLDMQSTELLQVIIEVLNQKGKTVLLSSHILEPLASVSHSIFQIEKGHITRQLQKEEFGQLRGSRQQYAEQLKKQLSTIL